MELWEDELLLDDDFSDEEEDAEEQIEETGLEIDASKVTVQVCFLPPLYYDEYKDMKTTEIAAIVQERIRKTIEEKTELAVY